jgi:hypothetical protein
MSAFQCFQLCGKALAWRDNSDVRWRKVPFHSDNFKFLSRTALVVCLLPTPGHRWKSFRILLQLSAKDRRAVLHMRKRSAA